MHTNDPFLLNIESQIRTKKIIEKLADFRVQYGREFVEYYCVIRFGLGNGTF